jgi:hypothetical protein
MPNDPLLSSGQMAVTTAATALPSAVPANPYPGGAVRGEGIQVILGCLKSSTAPLFYGNNSSVTSANGKQLAAGAQDIVKVNDTSQLFVVSAANGTSTATWSATNSA